jgi:hydrogenase maturation protease
MSADAEKYTGENLKRMKQMETSFCDSSRKKSASEIVQTVARPVKDSLVAESGSSVPAFEPYRSDAAKFTPTKAFMNLVRNLFPISEKHRHPDKYGQMKNQRVLLGTNQRKPMILVAGLGNVLFQDDGVGVHVIRELQKTPIPKIVYAEIGTVVLGALHLFEWADKILAVDAMQAGGKPGTIYTVGINDVERPGPRASLHQHAFLSAFKFLSRKNPPEISILGIEPETTAYGLALSPSVQASLSQVGQNVKKVVDAWLK